MKILCFVFLGVPNESHIEFEIKLEYIWNTLKCITYLISSLAL